MYSIEYKLLLNSDVNGCICTDVFQWRGRWEAFCKFISPEEEYSDIRVK